MTVSFPFLNRLDSEPFHPDENYWIYSARYFDHVFRFGNPRVPLWTDHYLTISPPVAMYFHGLVNYLSGDLGARVEKSLDVRVVDDINESYTWKVTGSPLPSSYELLIPARTVTAVFGVLTCIALTLLYRRLLGTVAGAAAGMFAAYNADLLYMSRKVLGLTQAIFFIVVGQYALVRAVELLGKKRYRPSLVWGILSGVLAGIGAATKVNAYISFFVILAVLGVAALDYLRRKDFPTARWTVAVMNISLVLAVAVSFGVNPYFWRNPVSGIRTVIAVRKKLTSWQQQTFGPALRTVPERVIYTARGTLLPTWRPESLNRWSFVYAVLLTIGIIRTGRQIIDTGFNRILTSALSTHLIWSAMLWGAIAVWLPLAWEGYRLTAIIPGFAFAGYGTDAVIRYARALFVRHMGGLRLKI